MAVRPVFIPLESARFKSEASSEEAQTSSVAAVLFLALDRPNQVLVGIRRPESSRRHPGVISIPTIRVPAAWVETFETSGPTNTPQFLHTPRVDFGVDGSTESTEGAIVELTLAKKLTSGDNLNGAIFGSCAARLLMTELVDDPSGRDGAVELTRMITIVAVCEEGSDILPGSTGSYEEVAWVPSDSLLEAWQSKDGRVLYPHRPSADVCVRGLCLKSAIKLIGTHSHELLVSSS